MSEDKKVPNDLSAERLTRLYKGKLANEIVNGKTNLAGELLTLQKAENMAARPKPRGIEKLRPKRRYNLSDEALEARRLNAQKSTGPMTAEGKKASCRNSAKHRKYASTLLMQIRKPCLSTCPIFSECEVVSSGNTRPGKDCLEKEHFLETLNLIADALDGHMEGLNDLQAVELAGAVDILRMIREDIQKYGTLIREEQLDDNGNVVNTIFKVNPLISVYTRMLADFGFTLHAQNLTPQQISRVKTDDKAAETAVGLMMKVASLSEKGKNAS